MRVLNYFKSTERFKRKLRRLVGLLELWEHDERKESKHKQRVENVHYQLGLADAYQHVRQHIERNLMK